jgi:hypothetical protein
VPLCPDGVHVPGVPGGGVTGIGFLLFTFLLKQAKTWWPLMATGMNLDPVTFTKALQVG